MIAVMVLQQISSRERARRAYVVQEATHSVEMEGGIFSDVALRDMELYINGEICSSDLIQLTRERFIRKQYQ